MPLRRQARCQPRRRICHIASRVATSAVAWATAALRAISSAWRPLPAGTPLARPIPISTPKPNCYLIGTCPEGGSDAHFGSGEFCDPGGLGDRAGAGSDLRSAFSGLHVSLWRPHLLRMQLPEDGRVRRHRVEPGGTVCTQSIFRERGRAGGPTAPASPTLLN